MHTSHSSHGPHHGRPALGAHSAQQGHAARVHGATRHASVGRHGAATPEVAFADTDQRPLRNAAALSYDLDDRASGNAPRVVAKGQGLMADEIVRRALDAGVPVHASRELVGLLMQVDLDQHVPAQLYVAVAEVLAWAWRLEREAAGASGGF